MNLLSFLKLLQNARIDENVLWYLFSIEIEDPWGNVLVAKSSDSNGYAEVHKHKVHSLVKLFYFTIGVKRHMILTILLFGETGIQKLSKSIAEHNGNESCDTCDNQKPNTCNNFKYIMDK
jgi:hypothetical protein